MPAKLSIYKQFVKYVAVGGLSNSLAYGLYIGITQMGANPIVSMSVVYIIASGVAFFANKLWTFQSTAMIRRSALRYGISQIAGYMTNLALLVGLSYVLGMPHYSAQLLSIFIVAVELFFLNRYYVFV